MPTEGRPPIVPVYLNQRIVFDLVAMLQDGIATVTKVSQRDRTSSATERELEATFGLNKAFSSLLSINLSGKRKSGESNENGIETNEDRVHTPASLFFKLREMLNIHGFLKIDGPQYVPTPGDLIEFSGSLQRNPIIEVMEVLQNVFEMADVFSEESKTKPKGRSPKEENWQIKSQVKKLLEDLKFGGTIDVTASDLQCGYSAVITAETDSLNDPTMSDLVDGHFSVVGKVIQSIPDNSHEINLMRKSTLGRIARIQLETALAKFDQVRDVHDFNLPKMNYSVPGPVIQVLPIAIFA